MRGYARGRIACGSAGQACPRGRDVLSSISPVYGRLLGNRNHVKRTEADAVKRVLIFLCVGLLAPIAGVILALLHMDRLAQSINFGFFAVVLIARFATGVGPVRRFRDQDVVAEFTTPYHERLIGMPGVSENPYEDDPEVKRLRKSPFNMGDILGILVLAVPSLAMAFILPSIH